ncbi:hypothetical protein C8Q74DRAFT_778179 [Fomes fomentarius]|nr:hypothetical protein C8Q74DRAFT_778179 [Fomes fomentarius]
MGNTSVLPRSRQGLSTGISNCRPCRKQRGRAGLRHWRFVPPRPLFLSMNANRPLHHRLSHTTRVIWAVGGLRDSFGRMPLTCALSLG